MTSATSPFPIDTKDPHTVERYICLTFRELFPGEIMDCLPTAFHDVTQLFTGGHPAFLPNDLRYHNLEHTLQATVCLIELLSGRHRAGATPAITSREFEFAAISALLHDAGYNKLCNDTEGTGAKYTFFHVLRGCAFAASYLPTLGATVAEVEQVLGAINCTGPSGQIARLTFPSPIGRILGCALTTADYLAQFSAPDYPDKLSALYDEFRESDAFMNRPAEEYAFSSQQDLIAHTPEFWDTFVRPHLDHEFLGLYRFLAQPYPGGPNRYLAAAERNIAIIQQRLAQG